MISPEYVTYFSTMAAVGATLFGLIFVAITIVPDNTTGISVPLDRQVRASTAYLALLNPLVISLFALVPHQQIGSAVVSLSAIGLLNTLGMTLVILRNTDPSFARFRHSIFVLGGFVLYGYEAYFGIRLLLSPSDPIALYALADLLIAISIFGVIRAWELIGMRQFFLRSWLSSLRTTKGKENASPK